MSQELAITIRGKNATDAAFDALHDNQETAKADVEKIRALFNASADERKRILAEWEKGQADVTEAIKKTTKASDDATRAGQAMARAHEAAFKESAARAKEATSEWSKFAASFSSGIGIGVGFSVGTKAAELLLGTMRAIPAALFDATANLVKLGDEMTNLSLRTGMGVDSLQKFKFAGSQAGVEMSDITQAIGQMEKRLQTTPEAFAKLGLSAHELISMRPEDAFIAIGDAIARIDNPAQQAAAAMSLLGKGGLSVLPLLKTGLSESADMAERLGLVMSDETIKAADDLDSSMTALNATWEGFKNNLAGILIQSGGATTFFKDLTELIGDASVAVRENDEALTTLAGIFVTVAAASHPLLGSLVALKRALHELAAEQLPVPKGIPAFGMGPPPGINFGLIDFNAIEIAKQQIKDYDKATRESLRNAKKEASQAHRDIVAALKMVKAEEAREEKAALARFKASEKERLRIRKETADAEYRDLSNQLDAQKELWRNLFDYLKDLELQERQELQKRIQHWQDLSDLFATIGDSLRLMGVSGSNALVQIADGLAAGAAAAAEFREATTALGKAIAGLHAAQSAFVSGSMQGGAAAGGAFGFSVGGPLGAAIGVFAGAILGGLGAAKKLREEIQRLGREALKTFGDLEKQINEIKMEALTKGVAGLAALFTNAAATTHLTRLADKIDAAGKHMKRFREETDLTQARLNRLSLIGVAMFQELRKQGMGVVEALKAMASVFDAAIAAAEKAGLELTGTFAKLVEFRNKVLANEDLVNAVDAWAAVFDALNATGNLTIDMFATMEAEIDDLVKSLEEQKFTHEQILAMLAPGLYRLFLAQQKFGFATDEATQALIDEAETAGLFEDLKDPMEKLVELQTLMLEAIAALIRAFGVDLPAAVQTYIDKLHQIPNVPEPPGGPGTPGSGHPHPPPGSAAAGWTTITNWGVPMMLHGTPSNPEYVLRGDQLGAIVDAAVGKAVAIAMGGGGGAQVHHHHVHLDGREITSFVTKGTEQGTVRIHPKALGRGYR